MKRPVIRTSLVLLFVALVVIGVKLGTIIHPDNHFPGVVSLSKFSEKDSVGDEKLLLPPIGILQTLNSSETVSLMHRYTNTYQVLCRNQLRVGTVYDGGKEVCIDRPVAPNKPCLVYSFGSRNRFDFEEAVIHWFGCEVHTFDPSMGKASWDKIKNPPGCTFHHFGLGSKDTITDRNWTIRTLKSTMKDLQHAHMTLDILKIDIEGAEWSALTDMIDSGAIYSVKQLQIEVHFRKTLGNQLAVLKKLYDAGFRIFNRERNIFCERCNEYDAELGHWLSNNLEMSFVNTRFYN